jgi:hypothetical protein
MMEIIIGVARSRGLETMVGHVLAANQPMLTLCAKLGFLISERPGDVGVRNATLRLEASRGLA